MKPTTIALAAAFFAAGCSGNAASNVAANSVSNTGVEATAAPTTAATTVPSGAPATEVPSGTPATAPAASAAAPQFTDLTGVYGADKIAQVAQLQAFDFSGPSFQPNQPVMRREFVRWLYTANNAIQNDDAKKIRPAPPGTAAYFTDLPSTDKDFAIIAGLQDGGISVGFPDKTFQPDIPITREQALAVALGVDCSYDGNWSKDPQEAYIYLPPWKDKTTVSKTYAPIIASCGDTTTDTVGRVWGKIAVFRPQLKLTRAEAALMIWQTGSRTAADAIAATPAASP
jgi:S-layer homology domain